MCPRWQHLLLFGEGERQKTTAVGVVHKRFKRASKMLKKRFTLDSAAYIGEIEDKKRTLLFSETLENL